MTFLVFGRSGQVARCLARIAPDATYLDQSQADLGDPAACAAHIAATDAVAVINAAAWTDVDGAEDHQEDAYLVNAEAPGAMAQAAAARGIPFVHISTDYVFDGSGAQPWRPDDPTNPQSAYGASKLAGERAVAAAGGPYAVIRGSWIFSEFGKNFVKTMLRLSEARGELTVVSDQIGGPTPAADMAALCIRVARSLRENPDLSGIYHYSGAPDVSWAAFAREIMRQAQRDVTVTEIETANYPTKATRPLNSRLDCSKTEQAFALARPDWRAGLADVLSALDAN
ncbi:MAG: dTDP-4-dehydrorhamnose reductase [Pseudomonadota bacterium]